MKAAVAIVFTEPQLALVEISEDPVAISSAARLMLQDLPVDAGDERRSTLEKLARGPA